MNTSILLLLALLACFTFDLGSSSTNSEKKFLGIELEEVGEETGITLGEVIETVVEMVLTPETKQEDINAEVVTEGAEKQDCVKGFLSKC